eukprot:767755-Rhodomonas_salina.1
MDLRPIPKDGVLCEIDEWRSIAGTTCNTHVVGRGLDPIITPHLAPSPTFSYLDPSLVTRNPFSPNQSTRVACPLPREQYVLCDVVVLRYQFRNVR